MTEEGESAEASLQSNERRELERGEFDQFRFGVIEEDRERERGRGEERERGRERVRLEDASWDFGGQNSPSQLLLGGPELTGSVKRGS